MAVFSLFRYALIPTVLALPSWLLHFHRIAGALEEACADNTIYSRRLAQLVFAKQ